jgi:hypothetical protein
MKAQRQSPFVPQVYLDSVGVWRKVGEFSKKQTIFAQGDAANITLSFRTCCPASDLAAARDLRDSLDISADLVWQLNSRQQRRVAALAVSENLFAAWCAFAWIGHTAFESGEVQCRSLFSLRDQTPVECECLRPSQHVGDGFARRIERQNLCHRFRGCARCVK